MQYYRPKQTDRLIGTPIPFYHEGTLHIFYLTACRPDAVRSGTGCQAWGHVSTQDLRNWTEHPPALQLKQDEKLPGRGLLGGTIVARDGKFFAALAIHFERVGVAGSEHVCVALSDDCETFTPSSEHRALDPPDGHSKRVFRDPCLFQSEDGLYHLLVATEMAGERPPLARGCLAHFGSLDLKSWKKEEPFLLTGFPTVPENPDYFRWNDWYYVTFLHCGQMYYRMSRTPFGPWHAPLVDTLDGLGLAGMKTVAFENNRRLGVGYLRWRDHDHDNRPRVYGGNLVLRELVQAEDGTLGTSFVPDMMPTPGAAQHLSVWSLVGDVDVIGNDIQFRASESAGIVRFSKACREGIVSCRIEPLGEPKAYGFCVRGGGLMQRGYEVRFSPHKRLVWIRNLERELTATDNRFDAALYGVEGLDEPVDVELILQDDVFDLCINRRRTLIARYPDWTDGELYLFCLNGEAMFRNVRVNLFG